MISAISFDFWNTLFIGYSRDTVERDYQRKKIFADLASDHGINISPEESRELADAVWKYFDKVWYSQWRTPDSLELLGFMCSETGISPDKGTMKKTAGMMGDLILEIPPAVTDDYLFSLLPELSQRFKLSIISDTGFSPGETLRRVLHKSGLEEYFSAFAFSDELGRSKPHHSLFDHILKGDPASGLIHIGDIGETDIKGAKMIGAKAVRYTAYNDSPSEEYKEDFVMSSWSEFPAILETLNRR